MSKKSFFEYLGISDVERIHSQFFAWLLSDNCLALYSEQKNNLLSQLFKSSNSSNILTIVTEVNGIDILIRTDNEIIVIENKLKSSEHSDQLNRYKEYCNKEFPKIPKKFYFLTLVGEKANNNDWLNLSYLEVYTNLKELKLIENENHTVIVNEYLIFLKQLTSTVSDFLTNPHHYERVFQDGNKKKIEKIKYPYQNFKEEFIGSNQLETILQKFFLNNLAERIEGKVSTVGETRGDALIDFYIRKGTIYNKRTYSIIVQLQKDNIKLAFAFQEDYLQSKKVWVSNIIGIMADLKIENDFGYGKLNKPKSKAYISLSKKLPVSYWKMENENLVKFINLEIQNAEVMSDFICSKIADL